MPERTIGMAEKQFACSTWDARPDAAEVRHIDPPPDRDIDVKGSCHALPDGSFRRR